MMISRHVPCSTQLLPTLYLMLTTSNPLNTMTNAQKTIKQGDRGGVSEREGGRERGRGGEKKREREKERVSERDRK